ncbi:Serine/threonine-protein phosphatase 6 regulatory subunit 1 [Hypsibius exemplaris]|uniref:Serine/threonine-protein phosphatase 6 regulatory subunit 1 n=1 Tax=Hypsibius exemplaris TaxID=2072580 RepID=A0A1W0XB28_HYPEX|nr:Serine/threonine-protein phosphatase 6 regulatory subunit 1 [Hypsibius exemplaris]
MFWSKFESMTAKESSVQDVLLAHETESVTLASLLEKEDCIQETKARNPQLIKVLVRKDILLEMVNLITKEPPGEVDAKNRFKDATVSCEMLNADVPEMTEALTQGPEYLDCLLDIFDTTETLNPILTSFVTRTFGLLIARRPNEVLEYLSRKEAFLDMTLKHLNVTAVTDLFIRLITAHENDAFRYKMCEWLNGQSFMEKIVAFLDASKTPDSDYHNNSAQLICDIIRFSREQQLQQLKPEDDINALTPETYANELLKTADSEAFIGLIVSNLIRSVSSQSAIVQCLTVLGAPFEFIPVNFEGNNEQKALFSELSLRVVNSRIERYSQVLSPVIPQLRDILVDPPVRNALITELAKGDDALAKRVGQVRLHLIRLVALLISFGRSQLNRAFFESGIILVALDMLFHFQWNSFFHAQVQNCVSLILRNTPSVLSDPPNAAVDHPLLHQLIVTGQIHKRIMTAWASNTEAEKGGKPRRVLMGHLLLMSVELSSEQTPNYGLLQLLLSELDADIVQEWRDFIATQIRPQAEIQSKCLAGIHPLQQILNIIHGPAAVRLPGAVAAFEYDAASLPSNPTEDGSIVAMAGQPADNNPTTDDEMRLRRHNDDEYDDEYDDDDDDMTGQLKRLATPKVKTPIPDWPATQPLNVAEKAGIERLEEAENANSPWDSAMLVKNDPLLASEFPWKPETVAVSTDSWADFSDTPSASGANASTSSDNITSGNLLFVSSTNNNSDSEGEPFEFRVGSPPGTPEPLLEPMSFVPVFTEDGPKPPAPLSSSSQAGAGDDVAMRKESAPTLTLPVKEDAVTVVKATTTSDVMESLDMDTSFLPISLDNNNEEATKDMANSTYTVNLQAYNRNLTMVVREVVSFDYTNVEVTGQAKRDGDAHRPSKVPLLQGQCTRTARVKSARHLSL